MSEDLSSVETLDALRSLQRTFAEIIRRPLSSEEEMTIDRRSDEMIAPTQALAPHQRLQLYAQQYWWRIQGSFDEDFPTLKSALSQDEYLALRDSYLRDYPSQSFTLRNLGLRIINYLETLTELPEQKRNLAIDCARYDIAKIEAFDGRSYTPISGDLISKPNFAGVVLKLQPYVQLLSLNHILHAPRESADERSEVTSNTSSKPLSRSESPKETQVQTKSWLVVHRYNGKVFTKTSSLEEFQLLSQLQKGSSLDELLESPAAERVDETELFALFQNWMALGWIYQLVEEEQDGDLS